MKLSLILAGALSIYHPNDGHNKGELACGGRFTWKQDHIAIRQWYGRCNAPAQVCVVGGKCVWTKVRDSGPWGATKGKKWEVQIKLKKGWRRRAIVDLSWALWKRLGKPRFLSKVVIKIYEKEKKDAKTRR